MLTVLQQFDSALAGLEPNPAAAEALARVRTYRPVLALVRRQIETDGAKPERTAPGCLPQLPAQFDRMHGLIERRYVALVVRSAASGLLARLR